MAKQKPITNIRPKKVLSKTIRSGAVSRTPQKRKKIKTRSIKVNRKSATIFSASSPVKEFLVNTFATASLYLKKLRKDLKKNAPKTTLPKIKYQKYLRKFKNKIRSTASKYQRKITRWLVKVGRAIRKEFLLPFWYVFRYHLGLVLLSILSSALILGSAYVVYDTAFKDLPSVTELTQRKQILTTKILDRNGKVLYSIYKDQNRTLIPLSRVPQDLIHATIAIEDRSFYEHRGISLRGIIRASRNTLEGKRLEGGSTITQQLVKNTLLTPERTLKRKVREILLAFLVEGTYTKDEILEMYFNEVGYGGSTYGVEEAAQRYFGKPASQLTLAECAFLAGLPESPTLNSPFGANPELAYARQHEVLRRMVEDGYITPAQSQAAQAEPLTFRADTTDIKSPHFVMFVRNLLVNEYGEDLVSQGGLEVKTTLDLDTQNQAQDIVTKEVNALSRLRISNGAAMITNPKTGEILSMVGSKNYFDFANDGQVNVTLRPRQPGSSIKPVTYSVALEKGQTPFSTILDEPITFSIPGSAPYAPKNYDGRFHGTVTLKEALASSYNIPAVKTLASVGLSNMIDKGEQMGITTWGDRRRFGLSMTLGSGEVLMYDMMQVYGTFANYGETVSLNPILEIKNSHGEIIYHNSCALDHTDCPTTRTLDPKVAYQITDILSDNNARTPAFGPRSVLFIPGQQVAVKTGTTNSLKDNWAIGYTTDRVVATWVGNNDGTPMSYVASGITGASPIWNKIIRTQLDDSKPHVFATPEGFVKIAVCTKTGTLPCSGCPHVQDQLFIPGTEPKFACNPSFFRPKEDVSVTTANGDKILDGVQVGE